MLVHDIYDGLIDLRDTPAPRRGRPKDPAKRAAILEAAKALFLRDGYRATSIEAVALDAGVSKLTVYSHFKDKACLFATAVHEKTHEILPLPSFRVDADTDLRGLLNQIGVQFLTLVNTPEAIAMHRLLISPAADPAMAELFFNAGPRPMLEAMETLLREADRLGLVRIDDPASATDQLYGLLQGCRQMQVLIRCALPHSDGERRKQVANAVDAFLRAYRTD